MIFIFPEAMETFALNFIQWIEIRPSCLLTRAWIWILTYAKKKAEYWDQKNGKHYHR